MRNSTTALGEHGEPVGGIRRRLRVESVDDGCNAGEKCADIADQMSEAGITRTAVIVVGDVLTADELTDSYLYSAGRRRSGRH